MGRKKTEHKRGEVVYGIDYQPSKAELEEPIKPPKELMDLPMPERLEEAARRILQSD